jgi:hypothetical protein
MIKLYILDHFHYLTLQTLTTQQPYMSKPACAPYLDCMTTNTAIFKSKVRPITGSEVGVEV